jgi:hypothetical protein
MREPTFHVDTDDSDPMPWGKVTLSQYEKAQRSGLAHVRKLAHEFVDSFFDAELLKLEDSLLQIEKECIESGGGNVHQ